MNLQSLIRISILLCISASSSADPRFRIHSRPEGSTSGVRMGNGVVQSQAGGTLWITQGDGSVRILSVSDDDISEVQYRPISLTNRTLECRSLITLYVVDDLVRYGVYSVIDIPTSGDQKVVSRVISLSPEGKRLWEAIVPGIAEGTPQIGMDGQRIYITHNDLENIGGEYVVGKLSLIQNDRFGLASEIPLDGAGLFGLLERPAPFGPLSAARQDQNGIQKYYFGESWAKGESSFGFLYEFNGTHVSGLLRTHFSTITSPILSQDGKAMWVGGTASSVHAWVSNKVFTSTPSWSTTLGSDEKPLSQAPIYSSELGMVFVLTHDGQIFGLDAKTGETTWSIEGSYASPVVMQLSGDGSILFVIGTDEGIVTQYSSPTGRKLLELTCREIRDSEFCTMPVEGDFFVSYDGNEIMFATIYGDVYILSFDPPDPFFFFPTASPSMAPTNTPIATSAEDPTVYPTLKPSVSILTKSSAPTTTPTKKPTTTPIPPSRSSLSKSPFSSVAPDSDESSIGLSPVVSPALSPAFPPGFAPADLPTLTDDGMPANPRTHAPASHSPSIDPSFEATIVLEVSEVNLDSLMESEESNSTKESYSWAYAVILVVSLAAVAALSTVAGRLWQHSLDAKGAILSFDKHANLHDESSFPLQTHYLD